MVMASLTQQLPLPSTVLEVEDLEARRVLEFALELGFDRVILEGDCKILIKALQSMKKSIAQVGHIAKDVQHLASLFITSNFVHVCRTCNSVARSLARQAILCPHILVWVEDVPPNINIILQADLKSPP